MLKFVGRFLFFLGISALLGVGIYALVQHNTSAIGLNVPFREHEDRIFSERRLQGQSAGDDASGTVFPQGEREMGLRGGGHDFEGRQGIGILGIGRNLVIIALITLAVVGLQKINSLLFLKRSVKAAPLGG